MIKAAVLGSPISHSLSPLLHMAAYKELGLQADYQGIELTLENAPTFFERAKNEGWTGFSLTMPLKESVFNSGFEIEPIALQMRSANTLLFKGGNFSALSTDRTAFIRLLENVKKTRVAIIGGGGTARAALGALNGSAVEVDFLLRSAQRSQALKGIATKSEVNFLDNSRIKKVPYFARSLPFCSSSTINLPKCQFDKTAAKYIVLNALLLI